MTEKGKKRILLAEDDSSMRRFVEIILKNAGYEVIAVEDGLAAADSLLKNEFDCVIADAIMPNLSGFDLCRMARSSEKKIPCIILSGLDTQENLQEENHDLFDAFVTKDEKLKDSLLSALRSLFESS
ncbi:MAG: response regulator [Acidobacteria bacterium]|jgi:CheY-like chemotaxis protein|nr:MAG: response regulator [Acidobacteriota bacterium]GIU82969.1 MAG: hypothetical protein KatS3mg006_2033 [Pyrinomonadaceae bacterium]